MSRSGIWKKILSCTAAVAGLGVLPSSLFASGCGVSTRIGIEVAIAPTQQVVSVTRDRLLPSRWALVVDCEHPEWPARMILLPLTGAPVEAVRKVASFQSVQTVPAEAVIVRAGETVRLWKRDTVASLETTGVAEESGTIGKHIRVRLLHPGSDGEQTLKQVGGMIDGAGSVEMIQ